MTTGHQTINFSHSSFFLIFPIFRAFSSVKVLISEDMFFLSM
jgi:hypothetical protein